MTKHQEALDYIKNALPLLEGKIIDYVKNKGLPDAVNVIQELVDIYPEYLELKAKATPKKPHITWHQRAYEGFVLTKRFWCITCNERLNAKKTIYCRCGQKQDWSE